MDFCHDFVNCLGFFPAHIAMLITVLTSDANDLYHIFSFFGHHHCVCSHEYFSSQLLAKLATGIIESICKLLPYLLRFLMKLVDFISQFVLGNVKNFRVFVVALASGSSLSSKRVA
jgi:hypothetical protein